MFQYCAKNCAKTFVFILDVSTTLLCCLLTIIMFYFCGLLYPLGFMYPIWNPIYQCWAKIILKLCNVSLTISGIENLQKDKQYIFMSSHSGFFDIPIGVAILDDYCLHLFAKKELRRFPCIGHAVIFGRYSFIDRNNPRQALKTFKQVAQKLNHSNNITSCLLYPEGKRNHPNKPPQDLKSGGFQFAKMTHLPIVPISLSETQCILKSKSIRIHRGNTIQCIIHKPIETTNLSAKELKHIVMQNFHEGHKIIMEKKCQKN